MNPRILAALTVGCAWWFGATYGPQVAGVIVLLGLCAVAIAELAEVAEAARIAADVDRAMTLVHAIDRRLEDAATAADTADQRIAAALEDATHARARLDAELADHLERTARARKLGEQLRSAGEARRPPTDE